MRAVFGRRSPAEKRKTLKEIEEEYESNPLGYDPEDGAAGAARKDSRHGGWQLGGRKGGIVLFTFSNIPENGLNDEL